jgi:hypothetical protein
MCVVLIVIFEICVTYFVLLIMNDSVYEKVNFTFLSSKKCKHLDDVLLCILAERQKMFYNSLR